MPRTSRVPLFALAATFLAVAAAPLACSSSASPIIDDVPPTATNQESTEPAPTAAPTAKEPTKRDPDEALPPELSSISPSSATVGSVGPSIVVAGTNFVPRSIVQLDGAPLATSFVSGTELRATIPTNKLLAIGTLHLSVGTSAPGGGASKEVTFEVENPTASLTSLLPLSVIAGASATTLHVTGAGFVSGAKVFADTTPLATTFVTSTTLEATIPAALLAASGSLPIKVNNPAPGGGDSSAIAFTVANPDAALQTINPSAAFVGSAALQMTVNGGGFVGASSVVFNGTSLVTTFVNGGQLTATVPANLLGAAGDFPVSVKNPPPGGGVSTPIVFRVQYPAPSASSLSPASAAYGSGPTEVTVTGIGFFLTSQITFDGAAAATTYVDATHLKATLSATQLATAGSIAVRVVNSTPGGGTSPAVSFAVNNPTPAITSLNPTSVPAGSGDRVITLIGTGFVPGSIVKSNGVTILSGAISATQMTATVPSNQLVYPGNVALTVTNPTPGGGASGAKNLTVGCDTSGVDVALGAVGTTTTLTTSFSTAPAMSRFVAASSCNGTSINPNIQQPGRYWVVQNTSGSTVTLSAWAVCGDGKGDAFLTFYKRPTPPASDIERLACEGAVAEGVNGAGGFSSPESNGGMDCPGLTKNNGGGLALGVCEKAVVHIQPWDNKSTTYTPPPQLKVKPE